MNLINTPPAPLMYLVRKRDFYCINEDVAQFPTVSNRPHPSHFKLFHFNDWVSKKTIVEKMGREGYNTANHYELVSWEGWDMEKSVIALGTVIKLNGFHNLVLGLSIFKKNPILVCPCLSRKKKGWSPDNYFLGVHVEFEAYYS